MDVHNELLIIKHSGEATVESVSLIDRADYLVSLHLSHKTYSGDDLRRLRSLPVKINSVINYLQEDEVFGMRNSYYNNALASCEKWLQELDLPNVTNLEYLRNCENEIIEMLLNELSAIKAVKFITNHNAPLEPYFHVANIGEYINVGGNYYCVTAGAWYEDIS